MLIDHNFLKTHVLYTGDDYKGINSIIAQVLGILAFLVDYGVYNTDDEVLEIVNILISILDGESDVTSSGESTTITIMIKIVTGNVLEINKNKRCSSDTPGNKIIFKIKFL